ncbi:hypothetical protein [Thermicanus aegyptius]|uniref:hypothetical protein n=1 Tax=Thermicanus aegyptius TaxID=94009 RepID=UPI000490651C|nr:hypothetical protein [Thermicanus aegyptius]
MKNHVWVNGRLLQTNKTWSHLKERQKVWIAELLRSEYIRLGQKLGHPPQKDKYEIVLNRVYAQIEERGIWIPFGEVRRYFRSKVNRYRKALEAAEKKINR